MVILGIESSCDETSASLVEDGVRDISTVIASSKDFHEKTGGVVPEIAARKQVEFIVPVIEQALIDGFGSVDHAKENIDAIAVTTGPGLVGSLIVGIEAAKALSLSWSKELIPVNHLIGHIYANFLTHKDIKFPAMVLVVSGGHTDLVLMKGHGDFTYVGGTVDDAAGEAFDKTARILGIKSYLGGADLSNLASQCENNYIKGKLPRPMISEDNFDFSFSGLKTAASRMIKNETYPTDVMALEFEQAVVDVLVSKTLRAASSYSVESILLGGGVSANQRLRKELTDLSPIPVLFPDIKYCGDNAAYIASAAFFNRRNKILSEIVPQPSLSIME
ncbi:MAG: tRNA (adenosine(37)-N6)-threonylcarbamoyltransferase complex transferase subunit TsaD [Patescibacteria group bacterium]|jgi:N6-L-threonylcarbamoyladenine synthase